MTAEEFLSRLDGVRSRGSGRWSARCPAHPDRNPSLSVREVGTRILLKCFSGCETSEIVAALGLRVSDLFFDDARNPRGYRPQPRPPRLDRIARAFTNDLAALDRRIRAEQILDVAKDIVLSALNDDELDLALTHIGKAYRDFEQAELLEHVADRLREKDFNERKSHERSIDAA